MHVLPSPQVHANQADEIYLRIGDKSKKLNFAQRLQLLYSKGTRFFEDTPVPNATINDIDLDFVAAYTKKIGYGRSPLDYLRGNKDFIITRNGTEQIISATILLFGKNILFLFPFIELYNLSKFRKITSIFMSANLSSLILCRR